MHTLEKLHVLSPPEAPGWHGIVGASPAIKAVVALIETVACASAPVMIMGESGTGKELAARAIHRLSAFAAGPFVATNCGALPAGLVASELFGHEKGAFTGAHIQRIGRIEAARHGTLFLDEIGDLPLDMQVHLLRFLQEGTIERLGNPRPLPVALRVLSGTHVDLPAAVRERRFREDLFYRLNVIVITMPPLRDRDGDIPLLAEHFLRREAAELGRPIQGFHPAALAALRDHPWPGNVRELENIVRRACVLARGGWIAPDHLGLSDSIRPEPVAAGGAVLPTLDTALRATEEMLLRRTVARFGDNVPQAAHSLGVSRATFYRLLAKYRLERTVASVP